MTLVMLTFKMLIQLLTVFSNKEISIWITILHSTALVII